jgi:cellulose synthase (UDP-forming)
MNPEAPFFSWILLAAEAFGVLNYLLFAWITNKVEPTRAYRVPRAALSVDVYIPTYNEDIDILEATISGAVGIRYPHKTYVLDDGRRPQVNALARRLGAIYLTRENNMNHKAGNINHALGKTKGEFIAILDADMVPQPDYLDRTLGYFEDRQLAFVQLPQEFYNQDSIQHDPRRAQWHEQTLFFRVIQPGKNYSNSAFWTGSPSVVRRKALEEVGGVASETITEDIHTSVRLHSKGWKSYFLNEVLAYGIAPHTVHAFLLQRLRWAQGTMQLYRSKDNPLLIPGLTISQRVSYLASFLAYAEAIQKMLLILTPTIIILLQIFPMNVNGVEFTLRWLPYFGLTILANKMAGRGYFNWFQTEKYNLLKTITFLQSFPMLIWPKTLAFKVTPKTVDDQVSAKERASMRGYMALFGVIVGVSFAGITRLMTGLPANLEPTHYGIAIVWAVFNAGIILLGMRDVLTKRHLRKDYRFPFKSPAFVYSNSEKSLLSVSLENISFHGVGFVVTDKADIPRDKLDLYLPTPSKQYLLLPLEGVKVRRSSAGKRRVGAIIGELTKADHIGLVEMLFVTLPSLLPDRGYQPERTYTPQASALPVDFLFRQADRSFPLPIRREKADQSK